MSAVPTLVVMLLVGDAWGGWVGLYWAAGIAWVLSVTASAMLEKHQLRQQEERDALARKTLAAVKALGPSDVADDVWSDIKRLLRHNPNINPDNLAESRDAVLWCYAQDGSLPTGDMDMLAKVLRYHVERDAEQEASGTA